MSLRAVEIFRDIEPYQDPSIPKYTPTPFPAPANGSTLNAVVVFDHINADTNGFALQVIRDALVSNVPVFCQRNTLKGSLLRHDVSKATKDEVEKILRNECHKIFTDCVSKEQLLILPPDFDTVNLFLYGINSARIDSSTAEDIFADNSTHQSTIKDFTNMLSVVSRGKLHLFLAGHGLTHKSMAGLPLSAYRAFLEHLNKVHCKALYVISCFAGGINKRYHIPTRFPIIVKSAGEFEATHEKTNFQEFFKKIRQVTEHPKGPSISRFKKEITPSTRWKNGHQVRLPGKRFIPLNESKNSYIIGRKVRARHLVNSKTELLHLQVKEINAPIHFSYSQPVFNSLLQSPIHAFEHATTELDLIEFFQPTLDAFSGSLEMRDHIQILFFKKFMAKNTLYNNVLVICSAVDYRKIFAYNTNRNEYTCHFKHLKNLSTNKNSYLRSIRELLPKKYHTKIIEE